MARFAVLLRGVNVGKGNRVPMADFRALLAGLGYADVATLLNSGNAVFSGPGGTGITHARAIAAELASSMGVRVAVVVKSAVQLRAIVAGNPLPVPPDDHSRFMVVFAQDRAGLKALEPLQALAQTPERLAIGPDAAYLHCAAGVLDSPVGAALLGKAGRSVTTRNWATTLKLLALCDVA